MSSEIRLAFAHPSERAIATADGGPVDRISLRDHIVEVEIGAFQAERGTRQRVCFNVVVEVQPIVGHIDDDVDRILSYDRVTEAIATELGAEGPLSFCRDKKCLPHVLDRCRCGVYSTGDKVLLCYAFSKLTCSACLE